MKKYYFLILFAVVAAGLFLVLKTIKPQPVEILKPSVFEKPEEIGAVVFRRFYAPLENQKVVVFGTPTAPLWHLEIVRGFLKAAAAEKRGFDAVVAEPQMPPLAVADIFTSSGMPIELHNVPMNMEDPTEFITKVHALTAQGKRVLIYTAGVFSTHILRGNPLHRYETVTGEHLFSITAAPLSIRPNQEFLIDPACVGAERNQMGTSDLGCAILHASRTTYRKNMPNDKYVAVMNQQGPDDYLLMTAAPGQDEVAEKGAEAFRMNAPGPFGVKSKINTGGSD